MVEFSLFKGFISSAICCYGTGEKDYEKRTRLESGRECISWGSVCNHFPFANCRFVLPEYAVVPPDAEEPKIMEPRNWFWQRSKKEDKKD
jgi:hypothetical protein